MRASIRLLALIYGAWPLATQAQGHGVGREVQIANITKSLIKTPDYGIVEFVSAPEWTNESTLSPISGSVLSKNETPFAPLSLDRYAQIKPR
jgi:hypothetical protein